MAVQQGTSTAVDERENVGLKKRKIVTVEAKKLLLGAGARVLFYPTLLYNVVRSKIQSDFRWWDEVCKYLLLGAVPFPKDVPRLKRLGVGAVITLNEPFETLVSPSLYKAHGMEHLVIPTRDYLYAPSSDDINRAVDFIHHNASCGITTYLHCKAGRGRSTTIALCYLVKYEQMTPDAAMELIRSKRARVLLTSMQLKAVDQYYRSCLAATGCSLPSEEAVLVTKADIEGYKEKPDDSLTVKPLPMLMRLSSILTTLPIVACQCVSAPIQQPKPKTRP